MYITDLDAKTFNAMLTKQKIAKELGCLWYIQIGRHGMGSNAREAVVAVIKPLDEDTRTVALMQTGAEYLVTKDSHLLRVFLEPETAYETIKEALEQGVDYSGYLGKVIELYHCSHVQRLGVLKDSMINFQEGIEEFKRQEET